MDKTIIFLHIPKTGGTSLIDIMEQQYGTMSRSPDSDFIDMSEWVKFNEELNCKAVAGHFPYGIHELFADYHYITILRHPVERIVSLYYYIIALTGSGRDWWAEQGVYQGINLEKFIELPLVNLSNGMVRQLSGQDFYYQFASNQVSIDDYELAVSRLSKMTVGITEDMTTTIKKFSGKFGWKVGRVIPHLNKTSIKNGNYRSGDLYRIYSRIMDRNQFDTLLYHTAKVML